MHRVLPNNKKEMNYRYVEQLDKSPKNYAKWKKLISKVTEYIFYYIIFFIHVHSQLVIVKD